MREALTPRIVRFARTHALLLIAAVVLAAAVTRIVVTARAQGITYDEALHLAWSERFLADGTTERWSVAGYDSKTPISVPNAVFHRLTDDASTSLWLARLPMAAWFVLLAVATGLLACRLGPPAAGPVAVILVGLEPNLVAHSTVVTVDIPLAACAVLAVLAVLAFWERPSPSRGALCGAALGATAVAKFSAVLVAFPVFAAAVVAVIVRRDRVPRRGASAGLRGAGSLLACGAAALLVIMLAFGCQGMFVRLDEIRLASAPLSALQHALPWLRLPLPEAFVTGLDMCVARERGLEWNVVLLGDRHSGGVWYYYLYHWLIKTPLGIVAVTPMAIAIAVRRRMCKPAHLIVAAAFAIPLAYFSLIFRDQVGYRFALLCVPLALAYIAAALVQLAPRRAIVVTSLVVVLVALENLPYWGNPLSFTNTIVLDKRRAYEWVADSNLDWGQHDAAILARTRDLDHLDPPHPLIGRNVFSVNTITGVWGRRQFEAYRWLRDNLSPSETLDDTHVVFDLDAPTFERMLVEARTFGRYDAERHVIETNQGGCAIDHPIGQPILLRKTTAMVCVDVDETAVIELAVTGRPDGYASVRIGGRVEIAGTSHELWYRLLPGSYAFHTMGIGNVTVRVARGRARVEAGDTRAGTSH